MKRLVIEKTGKDIFAYIESKKHHKTLKHRATHTGRLLDSECNLGMHGDFKLVFKVVKPYR